MYQHILLAVALQRWEEPGLHALAAREVAVSMAKGTGAKLSVLKVYDYGTIEKPGVPLEMASIAAQTSCTRWRRPGSGGKTTSSRLMRRCRRSWPASRTAISPLPRCSRSGSRAR